MGGAFDTFEAAVRVGMGPAWWAAKAPERLAIIAPTGNRTYDGLNRRANQLVRALRRAGLSAGDGVALLCSNRAEFADVWAACQRAGLRLTTVNWHLTGDEAAYIVADSRAKAFVAEASMGEVAERAAADSPELTSKLSIAGPIDGFTPLEEAIAGEPGNDIEDPELGTSMLYTSGTTGRPKGVQRPADPDALVVGLLPYGYAGDRHAHLCTGPLYHAAPFAISLTLPLTAGVPLVLMSRWDAEECLRLVDEHNVTHTHLVPTMFHRLLALPDDVREQYDVSSLLAVVHGAAPCPVAVKRAMIDWVGPIVFEYYAATEGAGTLVDSNTWLRKPGTVGRPTPADQVMIGTEEGVAVATGEVGLVWLKISDRSPFEYFNDADKTAGAHRGNYFTLGDMGYLDEDGFLFLTDRTANVIISGGVNVYPAEVDAVLLEHTAVADAATIGLPDEEWGEKIVAVVELKPECPPSTALARELVAFCRERLAHFKCPQEVEFVDHLPRHDNGKIYKRRLRDEFRERRAAH
jgi:long-chain acyl-CoA synthetase